MQCLLGSNLRPVLLKELLDGIVLIIFFNSVPEWEYTILTQNEFYIKTQGMYIEENQKGKYNAKKK